MSSRYLDVTGFKLRTIMPSGDVDALETLEPGWTQQKIDDWGDELDARLGKRYAVPFGDAGTPRTNVPPTVLRWLTALVTRDTYLKRGFNPSSQQDQLGIFGMAEKAETELKEAADSQAGLFELPLKASDTSDGITRGGPLAYSEASPYTAMTLQAEDGYAEDASS